jgi:hypothetical protein
MEDGLIAIGDLSRQSLRLAPARISPDCSILRLVASVPISRYFLSIIACDKVQAAENSKGNVEEVVEGLESRKTEAESRRIIDNNNPELDVSLPGRLVGSFTGSNAAIAILVGFGLDVLNLSTRS